MVTSRRLDAFDQWCLRRILRIPYTAHVTNEEVRRRTGQPPVTSTIVSRRLRLFGHIARADPSGPSQDHSRALQAAINRLPTDWRRRRGRPRRTWLRTIESDLQAATDQSWPQLCVASRTRSLQMAFSCGDGYAHRWACHLMMMMMMILSKRLNIIIIKLFFNIDVWPHHCSFCSTGTKLYDNIPTWDL